MSTPINLDGESVDVERSETVSVRVQGLGKVDVVANGDATVQKVLAAALKGLGADPAAADNLFPVHNGDDVDNPAETRVAPGDRVTAAARAENG